MSLQDLVIITGMSGSGKGTVLRVFEDQGFFCVDNLPVPLITRFIEEVNISTRAALVIDVRAKDNLPQLTQILKDLRESELNLSVLFLEAGDEILLRRFSESRRPHPLKNGSSIREALAIERRKLSGLKEISDLTIDTSDYTVHQIRSLVARKFCRQSQSSSLDVMLMSFGFKYGIPLEADIILDVRFLPNPYFDPKLREFSGRDLKVKTFLRKFPETTEFIKKAGDFLQYLMQNFQQEGKSQVTIAVGCTGGRHRSVFIAEEFAKILKKKDRKIQVLHRDEQIQHG